MSRTPDPGPDPRDPYSRLQYRRLIAWPERIRREAPFLEEVAARGPEQSVLDLGCGTGEHARHFAGRGYRVVGLDRSEAQIAAADEAPQPGLRFVVGDLTDLSGSVHDRFGTAICLGNTLAHLQDHDALLAACRGVHAALLPGGAWLAQLLNYERIFATGQRSLPVNVREDAGETLVFLRLLQHLGGGRLRFFPTTLRLRPDADPPVEVVAGRRAEHRGWTRPELEPVFHEAGFEGVDWHGDMQGGRFDAASSDDLVFVARRA